MSNQIKIGELTIHFEQIKPLQRQVAELGVCPNCHTKTLSLKYTGAGCGWYQCSQCLKVFAIEVPA